MADPKDENTEGTGEQGEKQVYKPSPRDQLLEDLAAKSEAKREQDNANHAAEEAARAAAVVDAGDGEGESAVDPAAVVRESEAADAAARAAAGATGAEGPDGEGLDPDTQVQRQVAAPTVAAVAKIKVKVDGQEREVPVTDLVTSFQKNAAADARLAEANRVLEEARAAAAAVPAKPAPKKELTAEEQAAVDKDIDEYHEALYAGDSKKARELLRKVAPHVIPEASPQAATPDVESIAQQIVPRVTAAISTEQAMTNFRRDFKDVVANPYLTSVAQDRLNELVAEGKPLAEALALSGQHARKWVTDTAAAIQGGTATGEATTTTPRTERLDRKGKLLQLPNANARAGAAGSRDDDGPTTAAGNSAYVQDLKKSRGQLN